MNEQHHDHDHDEEEFDPGSRALCPDGSCIGVLDRAGRCKVCGREGTPAQAATGDALADAEALTVTMADRDEADQPPAATEPDSTDGPDGDDFADRRLCGDPSCIGVLDPDGRCKECGRVELPAHESSPAD